MSGTAQNFFTFDSFGTIAGASAAVIAVSNTYRTLFKSDSPFPAFVASLIVSFIGAFVAETWYGVGEICLIFLNACLLFCSSLGMQETMIGIRDQTPPGKIEEHGKPDIKWLSHWFRRQ